MLSLKPNEEEQQPVSLQKPSRSLLPSSLKLLRSLQAAQPLVTSPCPFRPSSVPPGFCRVVGGPTAPPPPPSPCSSSSSAQGQPVPSVLLPSPVKLLHKLCVAFGGGQPSYDVEYSHAGLDGFLYFRYRVQVPGVTPAFTGMVMILPQPSAVAMWGEVRQATAQQVLKTLQALTEL
ncbi:hypothetical protein LDENG_00030820 [Lucifuga dentata]|nr:hypothetical protein LDENG_00030820 [Lucifuga dentata]